MLIQITRLLSCKSRWQPVLLSAWRYTMILMSWWFLLSKRTTTAKIASGILMSSTSTTSSIAEWWTESFRKSGSESLTSTHPSSITQHHRFWWRISMGCLPQTDYFQNLNCKFLIPIGQREHTTTNSTSGKTPCSLGSKLICSSHCSWQAISRSSWFCTVLIWSRQANLLFRSWRCRKMDQTSLNRKNGRESSVNSIHSLKQQHTTSTTSCIYHSFSCCFH